MTQDTDDIVELQNQMKGFDKQIGDTAQKTTAIENGVTAASAGKQVGTPAELLDHAGPENGGLSELSAHLGIIPMAANPCDTCGDKSCTVRNMGMASINCKTTTVVGPGGIVKNIDR